MAKMTSELNEADAGCISASAILPEKSSNSIQATVTNTSEHKGGFWQNIIQLTFNA